MTDAGSTGDTPRVSDGGGFDTSGFGGGSGGTGGSGFGGGPGATGGSGFGTGGSGTGGGAGRCDMPNCIKMYMDQYKPMGTCTTQSTPSSSNTCYGNGVKAFVVFTSFNPLTVQQRITKPDGTVCLTTEVTVASSGNPSTATAVFRNPTGSVIATATGMISTATNQHPTTVTCSNGVSKVIPPDCNEKSPGCLSGTCM